MMDVTPATIRTKPLTVEKVEIPTIDRCEFCNQPLAGGHKRSCSLYGGKEKDAHQYGAPCPDCGRTLVGYHVTGCPQLNTELQCVDCGYPEGHAFGCPSRHQKKETEVSGPDCGCVNHQGYKKSSYPTKAAATWYSRNRWAGLAKSYQCSEGVWHLTTSGSIRRKKK